MLSWLSQCCCLRTGRYDASFLSIFPVGDPTDFIPNYEVGSEACRQPACISQYASADVLDHAWKAATQAFLSRGWLAAGRCGHSRGARASDLVPPRQTVHREVPACHWHHAHQLHRCAQSTPLPCRELPGSLNVSFPALFSCLTLQKEVRRRVRVALFCKGALLCRRMNAHTGTRSVAVPGVQTM